MLAGFIADNVFFGRIDSVWQTQAVFAGYAAVCFVSIPLLHYLEARAAQGAGRPRWRALLPIVTQFALGGFWSGFLIFYARSAVISASWPFILLLFGVFIANEYYARYHERVVFTSILFFFALYSYAIFALPIYTHQIGTSIFLLSGVVAIITFGLFTSLLRIVGRERFLADIFPIRVGAAIILLVINIFYFANILPPLPLSARTAGIYHSVSRIPGNYVGMTEHESWPVRYLGLTPTEHVVAGDSLYAYSSIFAPTDLTTTIVHRWQWYSSSEKKWVTRAAIAYPIEGGRDGGYRGYSAALMRNEGAWRVSIETADGRIIARLPFTVVFVAQPPEEAKINLP